MERYDKWTELQLQKECTRRYLDNVGHKAKLVKRIAMDDHDKREAGSRPTFTKLSDPTGKCEEAYMNSRAKFDSNYWNSILGSEIAFHEAMVETKKTELSAAPKKADANHMAAIGLKDARIAGYKEVKEGANTKGVGKGGEKDTRNALQAVKPAKVAVVQSPVTPHPSGTAKAPLFEKFTPVPTTTTQKTTSAIKTSTTNIEAVSCVPTVKKTYEPMPVIESAFHKAPPPKAAKKPRANAKKAATEPEPKPQAKKFMTAAGAAYLKSLESGDTTDYDSYVAPAPTLKRPSQETEASIAKKLRLNPEDVPNPDLNPNLIEQDSVQSDLINIGYLFLPCEDEKKIRRDALSFLKHEYRTFAVTEVRADKTGYFMVFEKTGKGDRNLKKCFELIDIEIDEKSFFDKNVTDVKISKRDDAVEEPEPEPESEPEAEPQMEEVNLGYTPVPYKKPAPRRSGWRR